MRFFFSVLVVLMLAGCETNNPAIPPHNLVVIYADYNEFSVYEDGYMCGVDNIVVHPVYTTRIIHYYSLPDGVYCLSWIDVRAPLFRWTLNGESVESRLYRAKILVIPEDAGSYDVR